jgi:ABC-2 type transport system ATP-binding protein
VTWVLDTDGLGKRYGSQPALKDCDLRIPAGRVVGLVGPNGAGKSTLLGLISGLIQPTEGSIRVLGNAPAAGARQLARVGFVAQDTPVYAGLTVAEHLRLGAKLNPRWDHALADRRIQRLGLGLKKKASQLSGGQRAQLALTIAAAKRPELLIFDEPVAALDPLARHGFLQNLMEFVAELAASVILSSHLLEDLERVCDYLIVLAAGRIQIAGEADELIATHYRLVGAHDSFAALPDDIEIIRADHTNRQTTLIIRTSHPLPFACQDAAHLSLPDLVLAYLGRAAEAPVTGSVPQTMEAHR